MNVPIQGEPMRQYAQHALIARIRSLLPNGPDPEKVLEAQALALLRIGDELEILNERLKILSNGNDTAIVNHQSKD